jgi:hypothetical protein
MWRAMRGRVARVDAMAAIGAKSDAMSAGAMHAAATIGAVTAARIQGRDATTVSDQVRNPRGVTMNDAPSHAAMRARRNAESNAPKRALSSAVTVAVIVAEINAASAAASARASRVRTRPKALGLPSLRPRTWRKSSARRPRSPQPTMKSGEKAVGGAGGAVAAAAIETNAGRASSAPKAAQLQTLP